MHCGNCFTQNPGLPEPYPASQPTCRLAGRSAAAPQTGGRHLAALALILE